MTGYLEKKGKRSEDWSVERPKAWIGYRLDNMEIMLLGENAAGGPAISRNKFHSRWRPAIDFYF
jgi:hypothetical protein